MGHRPGVQPYRNYKGEEDRPLTEQERQHLIGLMNEATVVVDKLVETDPEQVRWHARICESFKGTQVSVVATPWDHALANRVPLDLGAVAASTLDAKLAMAEVVLRGADRAYRRRQGLPEAMTDDDGSGQRSAAEPPRRPPAVLPLSAAPGDPDVRIIPAPSAADGPTAAADSPAAWPDDSDVRIIPAWPEPGRNDPEPGSFRDG